ncbi:hypothetical protein HPB48_006691 [Haemaphysalis longicornis]|uniref:Uncharacterized protein n=1 Tax=Haemaphysalis longicornis TaxID=44386 RepID=A0A9J6FM72_HAELO|nr:hypothetical protein HPB48_006691 [Haemaphysalis longicornis]
MVAGSQGAPRIASQCVSCGRGGCDAVQCQKPVGIIKDPAGAEHDRWRTKQHAHSRKGPLANQGLFPQADIGRECAADPQEEAPGWFQQSK